MSPQMVYTGEKRLNSQKIISKNKEKFQLKTGDISNANCNWK